MINNIPQTLVKVGRYDKGLDEAVKTFQERLEHISFGLGNTIKYAFYKTINPYLLMVSQQKDLILTSGYNTMLTVTSYSHSINREVTEKFERETGISLNVGVPEYLMKNRWLCDATFLEFGKNPRGAMDFLKGK